MNKYLKYLSYILIFGLTGCFNKDIFPDTPSIKFQAIEFYNSENSLDSLVLSFSFEDGGGNIGLDQIEDAGIPYHFVNAVLDGDSAILTSDSEHNPPYLSAPIALLARSIQLRDGLNSNGGQLFRTEQVNEFQRVGTFSQLGSDDPRIGSDDCENYIDFVFFFPEEDGPNRDRIGREEIGGFVIPNENYYNIIIDFYERLPNGDYSRVDFNTIFETCVGRFDGRIPIFDADATQGTISYALRSGGFQFLLGKPLQVRFKVIDRALNQSNTVSSPDFFLEDITQ
ncbi:hypothetical protein [Ekhidna sp.]